MNMDETVKATQAEGEEITRGKLVKDLMAVMADSEEQVKATANQTGERITAARAKAKESLKAGKPGSPSRKER